MLRKYGAVGTLVKLCERQELLETEPQLERKIDKYKTLKLDKQRYLYIINRAVSSLETWGPNRNGDGFPRSDLKISYNTFINSRVSVDHNPEIVIGMVIDSYFVEPKLEVVNGEIIKKGDYIENVWAIDKKKIESYNPQWLYLLKEGKITDTSMGANVEYSVCSVPSCLNKAYSVSEYCEHIKNNKMNILKIAGDLDILVYEICKNISFFEDSLIIPLEYGGSAGGEGADINAKILNKIYSYKVRDDFPLFDFIKKTENENIIEKKLDDKDIEFAEKKIEKSLETKPIIVEDETSDKEKNKIYNYIIELLKKGEDLETAIKLAWENFKGLSKQEKVEEKEIIMVDIDGVIMDSFWGNLAKSKNDKVIARVKEVRDKLKLPLYFITGRTEDMRKITEEQLNKLGFKDYVLIMRDEDVEKEDIGKWKVEVMKKKNLKPVYVFEDNKKNIELIKKEFKDVKTEYIYGED